MSFYGNAQSTALRLIAKFGQSVTHTIRVAGSYDYATGAVTVTETTQTVSAVMVKYSSNEIDGMLVLSSDRKALIAASGITKPSVDDVLTISGVAWTVKSVDELNPGGTALTYECQVRK